MKRREIFALVAGILGFVVDAIAIAAFFAQVSPVDAASKETSFPRVWGILLLVYGWFLVAWVLSQWKLTRMTADRGKPTKENPARDVVGSTVVAIGLLLLPIAILIGYDFLREIQGADIPRLEEWALLLAGALAFMLSAGAIVFGAIYGLLYVTNDEIDFQL